MLCDALDAHNELLVLAIVEPSLFAAPDASWQHYDAWRGATCALADAIRARGGQFLLRVGEAVNVLDAMHQDHGFDALYAHEETGADITYRRDNAVRAWASKIGLVFTETPQTGVIRCLQDRDKRQPIVKARLFDTAPRLAPAHLPGTSIVSDSDTWPNWSELNRTCSVARSTDRSLQPVSETAAKATLTDFLHERGSGYSGGISSPNTAFTHGSRLSVHIAWGTLSMRTLHQQTLARIKAVQSIIKNPASGPATIAQAKIWSKSLRAFQSRLHWHDHFGQRMESAPWMEYKALSPAFRDIAYTDDGTNLAAWCEGRTGHPMVDASIRCLQTTGFLNFRMRAMLVTVACFGLGIHWRDLQHPYAQLFRDYDPGIHYPQVQMQAGVVGINTMRVYSPAKQLQDQDPNAVFVRRWLPELADAPLVDILAYDKRNGGYNSLPGYTNTIDLAPGNKAMKDQLYAIRGSDAGRAAAETVLLKHGSRQPSRERRYKPGKRKDVGKNSLATTQMDLDL